jgi:hypothetical protein
MYGNDVVLKGAARTEPPNARCDMRITLNYLDKDFLGAFSTLIGMELTVPVLYRQREKLFEDSYFVNSEIMGFDKKVTFESDTDGSP